MEINEIQDAYLLLKRDNYWDKTNLFLRSKIATFENRIDNLEYDMENQTSLFIKLSHFIKSRKIEDPWFLNTLNTIDYKLLPKKVLSPDQINVPEEEKAKFKVISNQREYSKYLIKEPLVLIDGDISIFILATLWTMKVGRLLDEQLDEYCYGNRLNSDFFDKKESNNLPPQNLFKYYYYQYNQWRDNAISQGINLLEHKHDILLFALDIKQCFYHLEVKWDVIEKVIKEKINPNQDKEEALFLTKVLKKIHEKYHDIAEEMLSYCLFSGEKSLIGIPIGLTSSPVLANWELRKIDEDIKKKLRPIFYGRYVDDILIVVNDPIMDNLSNLPSEIIEYFLVNSDILKREEDADEKNIEKKTKSSKVANSIEKINKSYSFSINKDLKVQIEKLIIHYYKHDQSWAGLKKFKEAIRKRSSEFRFLPMSDRISSLDEEAFDSHYDGSINRFRSLIGISENQNNLLQFLYKQQLKVVLCSEKIDEKVLDELSRYFKGKNILTHYLSWEHILTLFAITEDYQSLNNFSELIKSTICKLKVHCSEFTDDDEEKRVSVNLTDKLRGSLYLYLDIAMAMAEGYGDTRKVDYENTDDRKKCSRLFRNSLLLRKRYIFWPLLEYSDYPGSLSKFEIPKNINLCESLLSVASRYLHLEDFMAFHFLYRVIKNQGLTDEEKKNLPLYLFEGKKSGEESKAFEEENDTDIILEKRIESLLSKYIDNEPRQHNVVKLNKIRFLSQETYDSKDFCIGLANVSVKVSRIDKCMKSDTPLSDNYKKQNDLFEIINAAETDPKADLVLFPEVYIPLPWLPFMLHQSRLKQIGFVFGLEHFNCPPYSYNVVVTLLPIKNKNGYDEVFLSPRLKNYYSPSEEFELNRLDLKRPSNQMFYQIFDWRGVSFSVFNCFELTDIVHRGLFRSEVDMLLAVEYNQDIHYFSNILESVSRDVHCFAIQANTSNYGDSRVVAPKSSELKNYVQVKGGINPVLLKTHLDIEELRDFQIRKYSMGDKRFKPLPAGYDRKKAKSRGKPKP